MGASRAARTDRQTGTGRRGPRRSRQRSPFSAPIKPSGTVRQARTMWVVCVRGYDGELRPQHYAVLRVKLRKLRDHGVDEDAGATVLGSGFRVQALKEIILHLMRWNA